MKKGILLVLGLVMMVSTVEANSGEPNSREGYFQREKTITFVERGIKFYVFPNGEFDFNTQRTSSSGYYNKSGRRTSTASRGNANRGIKIERDHRGKIRRIGNVFINYTYRGKIARIGTVFVDYRNGKMKRIGEMKIIRHPRKRLVKYIGSVKRRTNSYQNNHQCNLQYCNGNSCGTGNDWNDFNNDWYEYDNDIFYDDHFENDYEQYNDDDDFYYYKSKAKNKNGKSTILKRKKEEWKSFSPSKTK